MCRAGSLDVHMAKLSRPAGNRVIRECPEISPCLHEISSWPQERAFLCFISCTVNSFSLSVRWNPQSWNRVHLYTKTPIVIYIHVGNLRFLALTLILPERPVDPAREQR